METVANLSHPELLKYTNIHICFFFKNKLLAKVYGPLSLLQMYHLKEKNDWIIQFDVEHQQSQIVLEQKVRPNHIS